MAEHGPARGASVKESGAGERRRGVDVFTLLVGALALAMSVSSFLGEAVFTAPGFDPRWLLAGGAALLGVLLLVGSLRRNRRR